MEDGGCCAISEEDEDEAGLRLSGLSVEDLRRSCTLRSTTRSSAPEAAADLLCKLRSTGSTCPGLEAELDEGGRGTVLSGMEPLRFPAPVARKMGVMVTE